MENEENTTPIYVELEPLPPEPVEEVEIHVCDPSGKYIATYDGSEIPASCPEGSFIVEEAPTDSNGVWDGEKWVNPVIPITGEQVNRERDRRIVAGTPVTITGMTEEVCLSGDNKDMVNLQGLAFGAQHRLALGDTTTITHFRDSMDIVHSLVPEQVLELWLKGSTFVSAVYQTAWNMKDHGIPDDYKADLHWP